MEVLIPRYLEGLKVSHNYRKWRRKTAKASSLDIKHDSDYDYRSYFKQSPEEAWKMTKQFEDNTTNKDNLIHFPDTYKYPSHPTFSDESMYSLQYQMDHGVETKKALKAPLGGHWELDALGRNIFVHSYYTARNKEAVKRTLDYLNANDPEVYAEFDPKTGITLNEVIIPAEATVSKKPITMPTYIPKSMLATNDKVDAYWKDIDNYVAELSPFVMQQPTGLSTLFNQRLYNLVSPWVERLSSTGHSPAQASAIVANAIAESAKDSSGLIVFNGDLVKGPATGMFQMEPAELARYNTWLAKNKLTDSSENLLTYVSQVVTPGKGFYQTPYSSNALNKPDSTEKPNWYQRNAKYSMPVYLDYTNENALRDWNSGNPADAAKAFMASFEKPSKPHLENRQAYAIDLTTALYPTVLKKKLISKK